jgi:amino acid transporter
VNATIVATVVAGILAAIFDLNVLIDFMSIGTLAAYVLVAICVLILRYRPDSYDLQQPGNLVTLENGEKAKSLTYWLSGVCMVGFLIHAQVPKLLFEEGDKMAYYIEVGSVIPILLFTVYVTYVLRGLPETQRPIAFKVPLLPYFPIMNMIVNIYLMASLDVAIWYKLMCWLGVGFFIYFTYGVKNSKENPKNKYADEEKATLKLNEQ